MPRTAYDENPGNAGRRAMLAAQAALSKAGR